MGQLWCGLPKTGFEPGPHGDLTGGALNGASKAAIAAPKNAVQKPAEPKCDAVVRTLMAIGINAGLAARKITDEPPEENQENRQNRSVDRAVT